MEKIHESVHVFVLSVNFKHENAKTCMFPCKFTNSSKAMPVAESCRMGLSAVLLVTCFLVCVLCLRSCVYANTG